MGQRVNLVCASVRINLYVYQTANKSKVNYIYTL